MALFSEHADVSVRPAIPTDAIAMATIQIASWRQTLGETLRAETLDSLDKDGMTEQWSAAISAPPGQGFAMFTALSAQQIVGFCAVGPQAIVALEVDPLYQREGHGSRLLSAAVDQLKRDGATDVTTWIPKDAAAKQAFFASAGFGEAGRVRHLATGPDRELIEERWTAALD